MKDSVGNRLQVGNLLYWKQTGQIVKVEEIEEPTLQMPGEEAQSIPKLKVSVTFPVIPRDPRKPSEEQQLADFVRIVDPRATESMERAMGKLPGGGPAVMPPRKQ